MGFLGSIGDKLNPLHLIHHDHKHASSATTTARGASGIPESAQLPTRERDGVEPSTLTKQVFADISKYIPRGNVPPGLFVTTHNAAVGNVLIKGDRIFNGMADLIRNAKHEVAMQTFEWESGSPAARTVSSSFKDLERLQKKRGAKSPVQVKILVNQFTIGYSDEVDVLHRKLGARQASYDDLKKDIAALHLDPRYVKVELVPHRHRAVGANHSKSLVVDGQKSIICGANVQKQAGLDTGYRLDGDVAMSLRSDIVDAWVDEKKKQDRRNLAHRIGMPWKKDPVNLTNFANLPMPSATGAAPKGAIPMMVLTRAADGHQLGELPGSGDHDIANPADQAFISVLRHAQDNVHVMTPNLNDNDAIDAIKEAVKRKVTVQIILPQHFNDGTEVKRLQGGTNVKNVADIYKSLPKDKWKYLDIRWFNGIAPGKGHEQKVSHTKYLTGDGQIAIVGSSNFDTQSWNHSRETNVLVDSKAVTSKFERDVFRPSLARSISARP